MRRYRKYLSVLALTLAFSLAACSSTGGSSDTTPEAGSSYTGTVSAISTDTITITTDDGDEIEFTFTDETVFSREGMSSDAGEEPDGEMPDMEEGGEAPDMEEGGEAPDMEEGSAPSEDAGEMPEGEEPSGDGAVPDGDAGEMPEGEAAEMPSGGGMGDYGDTELTYSDISIGDEVTIVVGDDGTAESVTISAGEIGGGDGSGTDMGGGDGSGTSSSGVDGYDAVYEYTEDTTVSDTTIESVGTDENAVLLQTADVTVTLDTVTVIRDSDDSTGGDNSSFYGVGASVLATDGKIIIENCTIDSDADGGAGAFAYGDGVIYISDTTITTASDTSGGIHVAGGGTLYAWDLTVETGGESSAAIRSDRGSGTMVVDGGTYTTNWTGSPAVYSTADITVNDATLTANSSEAICIEGLNTIRLFDCDVTGSMQDLDTNDCTWTVILYQSMSGDSEVGNSTFEMVGGTLTSTNGGIFYTTNTESTFVISDVDITYSDDCEFLLKVTGNSNSRGWGTTGSNGADCSFTAIDQELEGAVIWDSISKLEMYLADGSELRGYFTDDETNAGDGGDGYANLYIDEESTWIVTGDSELSMLCCAGTITDESGASVTIAGGDGTVYVEGTSDYTITVTSYSGSADMSGASEAEDFDDYEVDKP